MRDLWSLMPTWVKIMWLAQFVGYVGIIYAIIHFVAKYW